jgi:phage gpG-like protein
MSKYGFKVDTRDLNRWVSKATKHLQNLAHPMESAKAHFQEKISNQFATETDPYGKPWEPLKPQTLARKKSGSILVKEGYGWLRDSFIYTIDRNSLRISSTSKVFSSHQLGLSPNPQREILGVSYQDTEEIARQIKVYVDEGVKA